MTKTIWLSSALAALAITGCSQATDTPNTPETPEVSDLVGTVDFDSFMAVANESFVSSGASEADLSGVVAALPDYASLTWASKSFDAESGATQFEDLAIGFGTEPQFGLNFETAKVWDLEPGLLTARLSGERLSESGPIFSRMEGENVSYFGVSQAMNMVVDSILTGMDAELPEGMDLSFDEFESNTDKLVLTGVSLRPWELSVLTQEQVAEFGEEVPEQAMDFIHLAQHLIAVSRAVAMDKSVSMGTVGQMKMRQPGADWSADFSIGFVGADNVQGFDVDAYVARDYSGTQTSAYTQSTLPGEVISLSGFPAGFTMAQAESYGASAITGLRLDKLMGFVARSEIPSMDERDLFSLGRWNVTDYEAQLNDKEILKAERAYFNGDNFEWFIPSDLSFGVNGATLNTGELTGFFQILFETFMDEAASGELGEDEQAEMDLVREGVRKAIDLLPEHGLDTLPFDADFSATWDADGGPTDFSAVFDADGFGKSAFELAISLPDYSALKAAYEAEEDDQETAFEESFERDFAFRGARFKEEDKGGYDKLFAYAHALGKEFPDEGWGAMLGNMEPAQLRSYLGTMMRMGKTAAAEDFPPAADWIEAYASYLETGGSFEFAANPPTPINAAFMERYDDEDPEPEEFVEIFGLTVTHTK